MPPDIPPDHLLPVRPIVRPTVPDAQGIADSLAPEGGGQVLVVGVGRVVAADGQDDVLAAERLQPSGVVLMPEEVGGIAGVDVVVRVAAGEALDVLGPAHPEDPVHQVRMPEAEAGGVVRPQARAGGDHVGIRVAARGEGQDLAHQVLVVLEEPPGPGTGMQVVGVPGLSGKVVQEEQLDPSLVDVIGQHLVHSPVEPLAVRAHRGGEDQNPGAVVPDDVQRHVPAERRTVPAVVLVVHGLL